MTLGFSIITNLSSRPSYVENLKNKEYPLHNIKGKLCTQTLIQDFIGDKAKKIEDNIKPKAIIIAFCEYDTKAMNRKSCIDLN